MEKQRRAVIDTSFWSVACATQLDVYLYDFYTRPLYIAKETLLEITDSARRGPWLYPDRRRMELAVEDARIVVPETVYEPIAGFGLGERHAIGLARELKCELLINDYRPYKAARELGLITVSVPEFLVMLRASGLIGRKKALTLLDALESTTADALVAAARRRLEEG